MNGYEFNQVYLPLKYHFTSDRYDVFKYKGKCRGTDFDSYNKIKYKGLLETYARHCQSKQEAGRICVANFAYREEQWLFAGYQEAHDCYLEWQKNRQSINIIIQNDYHVLSKAAEKIKWEDFYVRTPSGKLPPILQLYLAGRIHMETLILLGTHWGFIDLWSRELAQDPLAINTVVKLTKTRPFCNIEWTDKFQQLHEECVIQNERQ